MNDRYYPSREEHLNEILAARHREESEERARRGETLTEWRSRMFREIDAGFKRLKDRKKNKQPF